MIWSPHVPAPLDALVAHTVSVHAGLPQPWSAVETASCSPSSAIVESPETVYVETLCEDGDTPIESSIKIKGTYMPDEMQLEVFGVVVKGA